MSQNEDKVQVIQKLRETTGAGVMDCKRALEESSGDLKMAGALIRKRGLAKAEERVGRETGAGMIVSYVHNERIGAMVDLRAETDFVVHSEPFRELARELAMQVAAAAPADVAVLLAQPYIKDESKTVEDIVNAVIAKVGENVRVNAFSRLEV